VGLPRFGGHKRWNAYKVGELLEAALCECVAEHGEWSACRSRGSRFRWLTSTPSDRPMVTGEGHVVVLENGGG
jgi:hypothetical protein